VGPGVCESKIFVVYLIIARMDIVARGDKEI